VVVPEGWEFAGTVGVDSAHVLIGDAQYADHLHKDWQENTKHENGRSNYDAFVKDGVARVYFGACGGVVVAAGPGDGCYPVFIKRGKVSDFEETDRISHMMIDFTDGNAYDD
jgi:hypothetical protein